MYTCTYSWQMLDGVAISLNVVVVGVGLSGSLAYFTLLYKYFSPLPKSCQGEWPTVVPGTLLHSSTPPYFISPATPHFTSKAINHQPSLIITTTTTTATLIHFTTIMHCLLCIDTISPHRR